MDVTPQRLEQRITAHIVRKTTSPTFRQQIGEPEEDAALERESS
jgi:hypothetical protein